MEVTPTWSSTLIVFPGVNPKTNPRVKLRVRVRVSLDHLQNKYSFVYPSVKDFSLNVYDDTNLLHLVSGSKRLSFSQELTRTLTLGLSLGLELGLAWGHFQDKNLIVYTSLKHLSLNVYDDTNLFHLVSDSQRFSLSQELTPTLTLGLSLGWESETKWKRLVSS